MNSTTWTPERIAEVRARCEAATDGPWTNDEDHTVWSSIAQEGGGVAGVAIGDAEEAEDAEFFAAARTDLPDAIAEIERLRAQNVADRAEMKGAMTEMQQCSRALGDAIEVHARKDAEIERLRAEVARIPGLEQANREAHQAIAKLKTEAVARNLAANVAGAFGVAHEVRHPDGRRERFEDPLAEHAAAHVDHEDDTPEAHATPDEIREARLAHATFVRAGGLAAYEPAAWLAVIRQLAVDSWSDGGGLDMGPPGDDPLAPYRADRVPRDQCKCPDDMRVPLSGEGWLCGDCGADVSAPKHT